MTQSPKRCEHPGAAQDRAANQTTQDPMIHRQTKRTGVTMPLAIRSWLTPLMITGAVALAIVAIESAWQSATEASSARESLHAGSKMTQSAQAFLSVLSDEQKEKALMAYDAPQRVDWHFIPKPDRKGVQVKKMNDAQRDAAYLLLRESLSAAGYEKARQIMRLEGLLHELEKSRGGGNIRDPLRYYFTLFGDVSHNGRWGLSIEGHHLSLNFVVEDDEVISITPHAFATNPAEVKETVGDYKRGLRVISAAETLAFDLLNALSPAQQQKAIIADEAIREVRAPGEPQPPQSDPAGISYTDLDNDQQATFQALINAYAENMPADVAAAKLDEIESHGGYEKLHFAWAGAQHPGVGHYYRIQGPTVLIEFVNTQPDAAGNPANHIHSVWRDPRGDFAIPIKDK